MSDSLDLQSQTTVMILCLHLKLVFPFFSSLLDQFFFSRISNIFCSTANCTELYVAGQNTSGVYKIYPDGLGAFYVYCNQSAAIGGWTVIQRRLNGFVNFNRSWCDYKHGFGNLNGEFWLGLDKINRLTWRTKNWLRVDLEFNSNNIVHYPYAEYDLLGVKSELDNYYLIIRGNSSGRLVVRP